MEEKFGGIMTSENYEEDLTQELLDLCKGNLEDAKSILTSRGRYKYRWWESLDPLEVAWGQINEPIMLVSTEEFRKSLNDALGRSVWDISLSVDLEKIKEEIRSKRSPLDLERIIEKK